MCKFSSINPQCDSVTTIYLQPDSEWVSYGLSGGISFWFDRKLWNERDLKLQTYFYPSLCNQWRVCLPEYSILSSKSLLFSWNSRISRDVSIYIQGDKRRKQLFFCAPKLHDCVKMRRTWNHPEYMIEMKSYIEIKFLSDSSVICNWVELGTKEKNADDSDKKIIDVEIVRMRIVILLHMHRPASHNCWVCSAQAIYEAKPTKQKLPQFRHIWLHNHNHNHKNENYICPFRHGCVCVCACVCYYVRAWLCLHGDDNSRYTRCLITTAMHLFQDSFFIYALHTYNKFKNPFTNRINLSIHIHIEFSSRVEIIFFLLALALLHSSFVDRKSDRKKKKITYWINNRFSESIAICYIRSSKSGFRTSIQYAMIRQWMESFLSSPFCVCLKHKCIAFAHTHTHTETQSHDQQFDCKTVLWIYHANPIHIAYVKAFLCWLPTEDCWPWYATLRGTRTVSVHIEYNSMTSSLQITVSIGQNCKCNVLMRSFLPNEAGGRERLQCYNLISCILCQ